MAVSTAVVASTAAEDMLFSFGPESQTFSATTAAFDISPQSQFWAYAHTSIAAAERLPSTDITTKIAPPDTAGNLSTPNNQIQW